MTEVMMEVTDPGNGLKNDIKNTVISWLTRMTNRFEQQAVDMFARIRQKLTRTRTSDQEKIKDAVRPSVMEMLKPHMKKAVPSGKRHNCWEER